LRSRHFDEVPIQRQIMPDRILSIKKKDPINYYYKVASNWLGEHSWYRCGE
jgi:hypothetical protein